MSGVEITRGCFSDATLNALTPSKIAVLAHGQVLFTQYSNQNGVALTTKLLK